MKIIRKLFFILIVALLLWGGFYTYNRWTDGFSLYQITSYLPPFPQFEVSLSENRKAEIQPVLDQPFHYIGKGCQFYAFESQDGKYVIKFLKHKHLRPYTWLNSIPMPKKLRALGDAKIAKRKERVIRLFSSCKLAFEKMPEETGLLFIHLNRVPALEKTVMLVDKIGRKRLIDIDRHEYVLQKKAISVKETFAKLQNDEEKVKEKIQQLIDLVLVRCEKGIADRDRSFVQNVAFCAEEERAVFIDIGQFYEDSSLLQKEEQQKDLQKRLGNLHYFTERFFPHLVELVEKQKISFQEVK